ncbi:RRQRL motif-containing zinc-binding protein [Streptomyces otsuchiensis]|uniref:RRQRL motif-containing zinc-binding protein n=1 Tax=Streptomyces otsuchiensis TaxID=2681388 RepID=UPI001030FD5B|nr:RRQRL motif-containing zinc-binding protein [Streptomyces otsuchiensis]
MPTTRRTLTAVPATADVDRDQEQEQPGTYEHGTAPAHLMTRRQLRDAGLRPGGHDPVATLRCRRCGYHPTRACTRPAFLFDSRLALPRRVPTLRQEEALDRAMAARQTCITCRVRQAYCLPVADRRCVGCATSSGLAAAA